MEKIIRALIVDDERLARKDLRSLLSEHATIEVIGEADSVRSAAEFIRTHDPDLLFLDVQMPGESGFDLLEQHDIRAHVVFVTAFDEYAIRAFDVQAIDYLLKPVHPDRLRKSIERLQSSAAVASKGENRALGYTETMFITLNSHLKFVRVNSIVCIQSAADYTELILADGKKGLTQKTMAEWEERLPPENFCRIHRGTIVNLEFVLKVEDWFGNAHRVWLRQIDQPVMMSRRYRSKLRGKMG
jgi:two-component system LytT family response regulator